MPVPKDPERYKQYIKRQSEAKKGKHYSVATELKKGCNPIGRPFKKGNIPPYKGRKNPTISGEKHWNYKGGVSVRYMAKNAPRPKPEQCEVCNKGGVIVFEHNHKNNKFRGWLCSPCNSVLGFVKDEPTILEKLANYLRENG